MATGYVYDPIYLEHDLRGHPENRQRLETIRRVLEQYGMWERLMSIPAAPISRERLERVHTGQYIDLVKRVSEQGGGHLDMDTYVRSASYDAALMAAGGLVEATRAVLDAEVQNAFALVRPPGHHALRGRGMGFCLFNNVAVAARYALAERGLERVMIIDFDVHHGNGTQDEFETDPAVLYLSTHQYPHYPGTGYWDETGRGDGAGTVVNIPLGGGIGDQGFARILHEIVTPIAWRFQPQLMLVSAGYDAARGDPLAYMDVTAAGFAEISSACVDISAGAAKGRAVFLLEGGYNLDRVAEGVGASVGALLGEARPVPPAHRDARFERILTACREFHARRWPVLAPR